MPREVSVKITADTAGFNNSVKGMADSVQRSAAEIKASASQAIGSVSKLSAENNVLVKAHARVADAASAVRVAEERLSAVRSRSKSSAMAHAAAEENLAKAQRGLIISQRELASAQEAADKKTSISSRLSDPSVQNMGRNFAIAGAAIGVGVGLAVRASAQFESAISGVASTGNEAKASLDQLRAAAITSGAQTKFSALEAAQGEEELLKAGLSVKQVLSGGLTGALSLAAAGNQSVADSAASAATAINQFGLSGADATHVADRFVQVAGIAQGETSDVAEAFKNGAVAARTYGLSIDDASAVLGVFAKNGIIGAQAGTMLKSSLTNLYAPSTAAQQVMDKYGISVYDAAGKARPLADVAGQLQDKLGGLNEAARNEALKKIFGKEQLQGGVLLMQAGADGLAQVRKELDAFGTAGDVAATKMDNLAGDVENFKGSLDTLLIQSGSGANSFLRGMAQDATSLINAFGNTPAAFQKGALGFAAIGSASLLAIGGAIKLVGVVGNLRTTLEALGPAGSKASGAVKGLAQTLGVAAVSYAAFATAAHLVKDQNDSLTNTNAKAEFQFKALASGAHATGASLDKFFESANGKGVYDGGNIGGTVDSLSSALDRLFKPDFNSKFADFSEHFFGLASGTDKANESLTQMDTALAGLDFSTASKGFSQIQNEFLRHGRTTEDLLSKFPQFEAQLAGQAKALGVTTLSAQDYANWMGGDVPQAIQNAAAAAPDLAKQFGIQTAATDTTTVGLQSYASLLTTLAAPQKLNTEQATALAQSLFQVSDGAIAASNANIAYQAAIDAAKKGARDDKGNRIKGVDPDKASGRANLELLNQQATAYHNVAQGMLIAGKSGKQIESATKDARNAFVSNAEAMGMSGDKANALADKYGLIPKEVRTKIEAEVQKNSLDSLTQITALDGSVITPEIQTMINEGDYKGALGKVKELQKKRKTQVDAQANTATAENDLNRTANKKRKAQIDVSTTFDKTKDFLDTAFGHPIDAKVDVSTSGVPAANAEIDSTARGRNAVTRNKASGVPATNAQIDTTARGRNATTRSKAAGVGSTNNQIDTTARGRNATTRSKASGVGSTNSQIDKTQRGRHATVNVTASGVGSVQSSIDAIHGKKVEIMITRKTNDVTGATGGLMAGGDFVMRGPLHRSNGGPVWGAGTATSDSIPALLSNGEFVINAKSVRTVGADRLSYINRKGQMPTFATGGPVGFASGGKAKKPSGPAPIFTTDREVLAAVTAQFHVDQAKNLAERRKADVELAKAMKKLNDTQSAALDSIKSLSSSLQEPYRSKSTDAADVLSAMQDGAKDIGAFGSQLKQLKALGLQQGVIDQITADGAVNGGELAGQIIAGGQGLVDALNKANTDLTNAGTALGKTSVGLVQSASKPKGKPKKKKALGGYITGPGSGTSDSIDDVLLSNGEYIVSSAATAANRGVLDAINYGRARINEHRFMPAYAGGGYVAPQHVDRSYHEGQMVLQYQGNLEQGIRIAQAKKRDNLTMARLTGAV